MKTESRQNPQKLAATLKFVCCPCSVYCVVSTKKEQRLQTDLHLRGRNATMTSGFGGSSFMLM